MGLRDEITAELSAAFDGDLADAVFSFSGSRLVPIGEPDPISQTQPSQLFTYEGRGVFGSYGLKVVDGLQILRTDIKLTVLQAELTTSSGVRASPTVDDAVSRGAETYSVIAVDQDPAGATWTIQLRRT